MEPTSRSSPWASDARDDGPCRASTSLATVIGREYLVVGDHDHAEQRVTVRQRVQACRFDFLDPDGIPACYVQRATAGGYPVVAAEGVDPHAVREAVYLIDLLLAKRPDVRRAMIESGSRLCILGWNQFTTDQPEFRRLAAEPVADHPDLHPPELRYTKPQSRLTGHLQGYAPDKAPTFVWPERLSLARRLIREHAESRSRRAAAPAR